MLKMRLRKVMKKAKIKVQNDRATANKKVKCEKQICKERYLKVLFLICNFDF